MAIFSKSPFCNVWSKKVFRSSVVVLCFLTFTLIYSVFQQSTALTLLLLTFTLALTGLVSIQLFQQYTDPNINAADLSLITELKTACLKYLNDDCNRIELSTKEDSHFNAIIRCINTINLKHLNCENLVQELAVQIQEKSDQLKAQRKMDHDRNENLHKMFAGASHDLRQPLQAMVIFISAIQEYATTKQVPLLQKLEQVVDNLNHMFTDLLDISKLESRMKRIPKKNVDIKPLLEKIYDEFEALAHDKRIEFRLYNRELSVFSNPNMLERIIRNMISNAIRYTRTGGVLIGCRQRDDEVWIEVWDTGRGIPKDKMDVIFNEFVQIHEDSEKSADSNKGVGLGLFIVKRLAQLLGHSIIARSELHRGTMFRIVVPAQPLYPHCEYPQKNLPPVKPIHFSPTALHIVFIDDDYVVRKSITELLNTWGMKVDTFDGFESLEKSALPTPLWDLIISDFQLGAKYTGLQAIEHIRRLSTKTLPAIIITGTDDDTLLTIIKSSSTPWLKKPVKPAKLRALINMQVSLKSEKD